MRSSPESLPNFESRHHIHNRDLGLYAILLTMLFVHPYTLLCTILTEFLENPQILLSSNNNMSTLLVIEIDFQTPCHFSEI